mmetsp:Transcript_30299/g.78421  ORF Transcript_30299/g.78421 Transcript_30299/m.78421 type:complete len:350 (+) Transcript_30299:347-1396(+)
MFGAQGVQATRETTFVEFKAGRMELKDGWVKPRKDKGLVRVVRGMDELLHFQWINRGNGNIEGDWIIFPGDATWNPVSQAPKESRVFLLDYVSSGMKEFFWMQEPKADKDDEYANLVNKAMNEQQQEPAGAGGHAQFSAEFRGLLGQLGLSPEEIAQGGMTEAQLRAALGLPPASGSGGQELSALNSPQTPAHREAQEGRRRLETPQNTSTSTNPPASAEAARSILSPVDPLGQALAAASQANSVQNVVPMLLSDAMPSSALEELLTDEKVVRSLLPLLPEGQQSLNDLRETLRSPQFQQSLGTLSHIANMGQMGQVMSSFQLDGRSLIPGVEAFLRAISKQTQKKDFE